MEKDFTFELIDTQTIREIVYQKIKNGIIAGYFPQGERLLERDISEKLKVSRTPVREALLKLELDGLVVSNPYKGVSVINISKEEAEQIYELHSILEGIAARWTALKIKDSDVEGLERIIDKTREAYEVNDMDAIINSNIKFHSSILNLSGNIPLRDTLNNLQVKISILRVTTLKIPKRKQQVLKEHEGIFLAIKNRDAGLAQQLATEHMRNAAKVANEVLQSQKNSRIGGEV